MRKISLYILFSLLSIEIFSQQDPQFAQNADNLLFTNPAFAGMTEGICASAISRQQWVGFEGAPVTTLAGIHSGIKLFGYKGGIGLSIVKALVELHMGTVSVTSEEGQGTEFTINIPCKLVENDASVKSACSAETGKNCIEKINLEFSDIYN